MSGTDLCVCGDYRRQHRADGPCLLNGLGHGGSGDCSRFRLAGPFTDPTKAGTIFEDHSCYRCDSGNKPCIKGKGHERECDTLQARND